MTWLSMYYNILFNVMFCNYNIYLYCRYILTLQSEQELDEYCHSLLDVRSSVHRQFLSDLKNRHKFGSFTLTLVYGYIYFYVYDLVNRKTTVSHENVDPHKKKSKNQKKETITATNKPDTHIKLKVRLFIIL